MTEPRVGWSSTGHQQEVFPQNFDRVPEFDPRTGDHLWSIITMYRVNPETETPTLDMENLLSVAGPVCFHCEQPYTKRMASRRCKGG